MKPGDKVRIYQKPITDEEFEGNATLIQHFNNACWNVRFDEGTVPYSLVLHQESPFALRTVFDRHVIAT